MDFLEYITTSKDRIKNHLTAFIEEKAKENLPASFKEQHFLESLLDFSLRGKLIRGSLFLLMSEGFGVNIGKRELDIAIGIELMHSTLLIQDDVIDRDTSRRGAPTIFAKYENIGQEIKAFDPHHYGVSTAIVMADVAFFFAVELLASSDDSSVSRLLTYYAKELYLVSLAEGVDTIFGQTDREPEREDIYAVYKYKTARYTFSLPFEMAAIAAGANDATKRTLSRLGENAGIIFQLKDDEIGLFGEEEIIGKPVGSDIRENKKTIIRSLLYEKVNKEDREVLDSCFGNPQGGRSEVEKVKVLYEKYKIKSFIEQEIESIMKKVWEDFDSLVIKSTSKEILRGLLEFNLTRSY